MRPRYSPKNNIPYGGRAAIFGDTIYYTDAERHLRCMDADGGNPRGLIYEPVRYINVLDEHLYFVDGDEKICRARLDGSERQVIVDEYATCVYVYPWSIFFLSEGQVIRCSLTGGDRTRLIGRGNDELFVAEEALVTSSDDEDPELCMLDLRTMEHRRLNSLASLNPVIYEDCVYFCEGDEYYSRRDYQLASLQGMRLHGDTKEYVPLHTCDAAYPNAVDGKLYFQNRDMLRRLFCVDLAHPTIAKQVTDTACMSPQVVGNFIFFDARRSILESSRWCRVRTDGSGLIELR